MAGSTSPRVLRDLAQERLSAHWTNGDQGCFDCASRQGIALPALMAMTEHRSVTSVIGCFPTGGVEYILAARLLDPTDRADAAPLDPSNEQPARATAMRAPAKSERGALDYEYPLPPS